MIGYINSFNTLGTVDGPGVRFVCFMQGCELRCIYCHNPETWEKKGGFILDTFEVFEKVKKYKNYFGKKGGITVSGGEPLLQAKFVKELFILCKKENISTCLDTSGYIINDEVCELLDFTDTVLLDIKMTTDEDYLNYCGMRIGKVIDFLDLLEEKKIDTWIRHVVVKGINYTDLSIKRLKKIIKNKKCVKRVEFLPFRKLCIEKYNALNLDFKLKNEEETTNLEITHCEEIFKLSE